MNPNYYQLESLEGENVNNFLSELVEKTLGELVLSGKFEKSSCKRNSSIITKICCLFKNIVL